MQKCLVNKPLLKPFSILTIAFIIQFKCFGITENNAAALFNEIISESIAQYNNEEHLNQTDDVYQTNKSRQVGFFSLDKGIEESHIITNGTIYTCKLHHNRYNTVLESEQAQIKNTMTTLISQRLATHADKHLSAQVKEIYMVVFEPNSRSHFVLCIPVNHVIAPQKNKEALAAHADVHLHLPNDCSKQKPISRKLSVSSVTSAIDKAIDEAIIELNMQNPLCECGVFEVRAEETHGVLLTDMQTFQREVTFREGALQALKNTESLNNSSIDIIAALLKKAKQSLSQKYNGNLPPQIKSIIITAHIPSENLHLSVPTSLTDTEVHRIRPMNVVYGDDGDDGDGGKEESTNSECYKCFSFFLPPSERPGRASHNKRRHHENHAHRNIKTSRPVVINTGTQRHKATIPHRTGHSHTRQGRNAPHHTHHHYHPHSHTYYGRHHHQEAHCEQCCCDSCECIGDTCESGFSCLGESCCEVFKCIFSSPQCLIECLGAIFDSEC